MNTHFQRTRARLDWELDEGVFTRGVQMTVEVEGERRFDVALGDSGVGTPMTGEHILRVYCTIKPVLAVAVARAVDDGLIRLDDPLDVRFPEIRMLEGGVTLRHLLTHTAGMPGPPGIPMEMLVPATRRAVLETTARPPGFRLGVDAAYSEYSAWNVIGWLMQSVTKQPLRDYLRAVVLRPLGLESTFVGMTRGQHEAVFDRLGVNHEMRQGTGMPMLYERLERICTETNPAHGGYSNARDLARFYSALLARREGAGHDALPSSATLREFSAEARPAVYDQILGRECAFGLGFMTSLDQHAFGDACGAGSFGHSGNVGSSFAFADPARAIAVGVVFNGLVDHESAFLRRRALVRALYADLDAQAGAPPTHSARPSRRGFRGRLRPSTVGGRSPVGVAEGEDSLTIRLSGRRANEHPLLTTNTRRCGQMHP